MTAEAAEILHELRSELRRQASPWTDRQGAADRAFCSTRTIDDAANRGEIKRYFRNGEPVFKNADIDRWIEWGKAKPNKRRKYNPS